MKDSDLGIPARPGPVLNGPSPQPPSEPEKRGPGRPVGSGAPKEANVKPLGTERLIETKKELEALVLSAMSDQVLLDKIGEIQILVLDLERELITRRKGSGNAR